MGKNKIFSTLNVTLGLLAIIAILLGIGVVTTPKNNKVLNASKNTSSTVTMKNNLSTLREIEDEDEFIEYFTENNFEGDYEDYIGLDLSDYYFVNFDSNGGTEVSAQIIEEGDRASKPSNPVRSCYVFKGWYLDGELYSFNDRVYDDITLEAEWSYNSSCSNQRTYTVKFDSNGGTSVSSQTVVSGKKAIEPTDPRRSGYEFEGWYYNGNRYYFSNSVTKNITLEAKWSKVSNSSNKYNEDEFTIKFDSNGGTTVRTQYIEYGDYVDEPNDPTRSGYYFDGWYLDGELYDFDDRVYDDFTLEAEWTKKSTSNSSNRYEDEEYTVKFDSNGGSYVYTQYVEYGDYVDEPNDPTRSGYYFDGWYLDGELYDFDDRVYDDLVLEAEWTKKSSSTSSNRYEDEYTVKFDSNGGNTIRTQYVEYGDYVDMPNDPTRSGYYFEGWYLDGELYDFNDRVYEDLVLEAEWTKNYNYNNNYCKKRTETHYSISYVTASSGVKSYDWTIKLDDIDAKSVRVTNIEYLSSTNDYNEAYKYSYNKQISMLNSNREYEMLIPSSTGLKNYSLKKVNFYKYLETPYYEHGYWNIDASIRIVDFMATNPYYSSKLGEEIYFVPFKFTIEYTEDC